jgi:hypothetical protein
MPSAPAPQVTFRNFTSDGSGNLLYISVQATLTSSSIIDFDDIYNRMPNTDLIFPIAGANTVGLEIDIISGTWTFYGRIVFWPRASFPVS